MLDWLGRWRHLLPLLLVAWVSSPVVAQRSAAEAYVGRPYGVGRVTIPLSGPNRQIIAETRAFSLDDQDGRLMYPAIGGGGIAGAGNLLGNGGILGRRRRGRRILGDVLRQAIGNDLGEAQSVSAFFLFRGDGPLRLRAQAGSTLDLTVKPVDQPRRHQLLMGRWWTQYRAMIRRQNKDGDYPPLVERYLAGMLASRLGLAASLLAESPPELPSEPQQALELVLGTERLRQATMWRTLMQQGSSDQVAELPVPAEINWPELILGDPGPAAEIEPIAQRVPEECFYVRFGSFDNYLWMSGLLDEYGGDLSRMIRLRGHSAGLSQRVQRQLALKQSALAEILGGQVISDVAILGRDMFMREGAAVGILFEARNALLATDIDRQRNEALAREKQNGATIRTVDIAGHAVSFLSTPGNRLRSFYAVSGKYHLVTTSRRIVERFFETAAGIGALGRSAEFANARRAMPVSRNDTIFVYLSSRFFQGLASPHCQIELRRRMKAVTDIELVKLARLAAAAEGQPSSSLDQLIGNRLLPISFSRRPDGSHVLLDGDHVADSLRGGRGTFLPVPDVPLVAVTRDEADWYQQLATFYQSHWQQTDPLMVAVKRWALDQPELERVAVDAWMLPFNAKQYGLATSLLGPPTQERVSPAPGDVVSVQASIRGGLLRPSVDSHQLFLGLQDLDPGTLPPLPDGPLLRGLAILRSAPGYLGAWPQPGFLDLLPVLGRSEPDAAGYSRLPLGLWRRQFGEFSVLSFVFPVLESVTPHLTIDQADDQAQVRVQVNDLSQSKTARWISQLYYQRARQASLGNARLLHTLSQQLRVPRDDARSVAQDLLDVQLVCPLGGDYRLQQDPSGLSYWFSTAWQAERQPAETPSSYRAPVLDWFRGLHAELTMHEDKLFVHAELDMKRKKGESKIQLPFFNLFGGKSSAKPGDARPKEKPPSAEPLPEPLPPPPPVDDGK